MISVLQYSASDTHGGAALASHRIYRSIREHGNAQGLDIAMRVHTSFGLDNSVISGLPSNVPLIWDKFRIFANRIYRTRFRPGNTTLHSTAWLPSGYANELKTNFNRYQIVHLHWLGDWVFSIEEIGTLDLPIVWTLHDQWPFLGAEHYTGSGHYPEDGEFVNRHQHAYIRKLRPRCERGPDVNLRTWLRKYHSWKKPMHIVCPSAWMAECARKSTLMKGWNIRVIPYPIDLATWAPIDKRVSRGHLGLPLNSHLILFGASGGTSDPRKGGDLLLEALRIMSTRRMHSGLENVRLIIFGQSKPHNVPDIGFPIHYEGSVCDQARLRLLYSAADLFALPSRQDNLPNTGIEAHACGTPIVAFRTSGLPDIVHDQVTGLLAQPFEPGSLAEAIETLLLDPNRMRQMGLAARDRAERLWNPERIVELHADLYRSILMKV